LFYLATWQGLRGEDLDIHTDQDIQIVCAANEVVVTFTDDKEKLKAIMKEPAKKQ